MNQLSSLAKCAIFTTVLFVALYSLALFTFGYRPQWIIDDILDMVGALVFVPFLWFVFSDWKNKSLWVKGGAIGVLIYFVIIVLFSMLGEMVFGPAMVLSFLMFLPNLIFGYAVKLLFYVLFFIPRSMGLILPGTFSETIRSGLVFLLTGMFIGWLKERIFLFSRRSFLVFGGILLMIVLVPLLVLLFLNANPESVYESATSVQDCNEAESSWNKFHTNNFFVGECYFYVAIKTKDFRTCDLLNESNYYAHGRRAQCYREVLRATGDCSICDSFVPRIEDDLHISTLYEYSPELCNVCLNR